MSNELDLLFLEYSQDGNKYLMARKEIQKLEGKPTTLKNCIQKMEGNSTTPKNCDLTTFLHERSIIFFLVFSLIRF